METKHHSPTYKALLLAGPRLKPLQQVHAHLIVSGSFHHSLSLLTKLLTLASRATSSPSSSSYTRRLLLSIPNPDTFLLNSLITTSAKFKSPSNSIYFYHRMLGTPDVSPSNYTFSAVIKSCADLSALKLGRSVHGHTLVRGYGSDSFVSAALVSFYAKSKEVDVARKVFDEMSAKGIVAWNSMISGYEQNGFGKEAIEVFYRMREGKGVEPDSTTFVGVLAACAQVGDLELGTWVHGYVRNNGFQVNVVLGTSLINMYARCGDVRNSRGVFDSMSERNVITWTAMISAYGTNGYGSAALELFEEMKEHGPCPNNVTFVTVLAACAHGGLVEAGRRVFASMKEYSLKPGVEHYVCVVDMLGRAGFLSEAYGFAEEITLREPAPAVWTALLGACKMHKKFDLGVEVAEHLLNVEPENPGHYVMLSNIYALAGRTDRVEMVRNMMIQKGLRKQVGYSTIEVHGLTYMFSMGDKSHPETLEIYEYLHEVMSKCREAGYMPLDHTLMHELEGEEREHALSFHSEKLAVAYGLLKTDLGMTIRVVKNLRICEDCHLAIKYISAVTNREIIVRDKLRFHHFKDGSCSCLDYW